MAITAVGHTIEAMGKHMDQRFKEAQAFIKTMDERAAQRFEEIQTLTKAMDERLDRRSQEQHVTMLQLMEIVQLLVQQKVSETKA